MTAFIIFMAFLLLVAIFYNFSPNDTKTNDNTEVKHTIPTITGTEPTAESTAYINNLIYEIGNNRSSKIEPQYSITLYLSIKY